MFNFRSNLRVSNFLVKILEWRQRTLASNNFDFPSPISGTHGSATVGTDD